MNHDEKPLRVGIVTSTYARDHDDFQVPWMRELNQLLRPRVEHLVVMAPSYRGLADHEIDGIPVRRFRYAPKRWEALTHDEGAPNKVRSLMFQLIAIPYILFGIFAVFRFCIQEKINVLHVHWPFPHASWAILPKVFLGVKVITMSHGAELAMARRSRLVKMALSFLLKISDQCCANSSHTASEVKRIGDCDATIIPYGATVKEASLVSADKADSVPILLFCGRLVQRKGIDVLLHAMPLLLAKRPIQLVITGEGDCKKSWQDLSQKLGLDKHVNFAGFVSNEALTELYHDCTAYVHPAIFDDRGDTEGLGVVLIEALAHKKPVVASGVGGIVDVIIHEKTGLLVPEKNPQALADAIERVLDHPTFAKELGQNGFEHVQKFFDWDRISDKTLSVYQELVRSA